MLASALYTSALGQVAPGQSRLLLQLVCLLVIAAYFLWCWKRAGHTLAMKTWRVRLVRADSLAPPPMVALLVRFILAGPSIALGGLGLWWGLLDRDGQFLHDRLARTRLIKAG